MVPVDRFTKISISPGDTDVVGDDDDADDDDGGEEKGQEQEDALRSSTERGSDDGRGGGAVSLGTFAAALGAVSVAAVAAVAHTRRAVGMGASATGTGSSIVKANGMAWHVNPIAGADFNRKREHSRERSAEATVSPGGSVPGSEVRPDALHEVI